MESWTFPPRYDGGYAPEPGSRYWFPRRETMDPGARDAAILQRLQALTRYAWENAPFYRRKWDAAGFHPDHLRTLEDFESRVPVITKLDLRESQAREPHFGDYLCVRDEDIQRIHGTSGTTGRPTAFAIGRDDWDAIANAHARVLWGMGLRSSDTVFIAAIFSLYMGAWGTLAGVERLRARAFPFGAGAPGMTSRAAVWLDQVKPAAFYSTPSFALHLAEVARADGLDPRAFGLRTMFFSGEPGASVPGIGAAELAEAALAIRNRMPSALVTANDLPPLDAGRFESAAAVSDSRRVQGVGRIYVAPTATLAGDISIADDASVYFGCAIVAGDGRIAIGERTNVQDNSLLVTDAARGPIVLGAGVTIGHNVRMGAATIADGALIGMGAEVGDGVVVEEGACIGARAKVAPGTVVKAGWIWAGRPACAFREVNDREREMFAHAARIYVGYGAAYRGAV